MSRWGNASDFRATGIDWKGIVDSGIKGYELGERYRDKRDLKELGSAMAEGPKDRAIDTYEDTAQSNMLKARQKYNSPNDVDPMSLEEIPRGIPNVSDSDVQGARKKTTTTTKDWESWEADIRKRAGAISPERLQAANDHITKTQQDGFQKAAAQALQARDPEEQKRLLEEAYSYMPNGSGLELTIVDGQLMGDLVDEETGLGDGELDPITPDAVRNIMEEMKDPMAWNKVVRDGRAARAETKRKQANFGTTEARLTATMEETIRHNGQLEGLSQLQIEERVRAAKAGESLTGERLTEDKRRNLVGETQAETRIKETARAALAREGMTQQQIDETIANNISTAGLTGIQLDDARANNKAKNELAAAQHRLKQLENIQGGVGRELDRRKTASEIEHLRAQVDYLDAGGSSTAKGGYFKKRNDLYQRLNTASTSFNKAAEEMGKWQRRGIAPPEAIKNAYKREEDKYARILGDLKALDNTQTNPAQGIDAPGPTDTTQRVEKIVDDSEQQINTPYHTGKSPDQPAGIPAQVTAQPQAPAGALKMLEGNPSPEIKAAFKNKYGYLPPGI